MIPKQQILARAQEWSLEANVVEKDYVLGWMLVAIAEHPIAGVKWIFKGGTCLKKCFFETFRFSEDLDFSLTPDAPYEEAELLAILREIAQATETLSGVACPSGGVGLKARRNKTGDRTYEGSITYSGPMAVPTGPKIRFDLTRHETTFPPFAQREILHSYPDALPKTARVQTYSIEELVAEKCRALIERTRPRDLYDIVHLGQHRSDAIDAARARDLFRAKCVAKSIATPTRAEIVTLVDGSAELRADWTGMLAHQLPRLPDVATFVSMLSESLEWLAPSEAPTAERPRARTTGILESPPGLRLWSVGVPLEAIRFAASNHLLVELDYKGKHRVLEAYSLRRASTGTLLLFVAESGTVGEIKAFDVAGITNVSVTSRSFAPQWPIELVPGTIDRAIRIAKTASTPSRQRRPPPRR